MADISKDLQQILDAVYGEEVRGSIYHAINLINKISESMITVGNEITSEDSSTSGYYDESIYINNETWDIWECEEDSNSKYWRKKGNIKGAAGEDGENGNKWYRGTAISGTSQTPTAYATGIEFAYVGDNYINSSEGRIYHCTNEGNESTAKWVYDFTLTGGGGGGTSDYTELDNKPKIDNHELSAGNNTAESLGLAKITDIPSVGNGKITITQGGVKKGEFNTNQSGDKTIELEKGGSDITVDDEINYSSENPVQNKVIGGHLLLKANDTTIAQSFKYGTTSAKAGEHYMYLGNLWKCLVNTTNAPIEGAEWTKDTITGQIEELNSNLGNVRFGIDGDGNYGYYRADDSFVPFKSGDGKTYIFQSNSWKNNLLVLNHTTDASGKTTSYNKQRISSIRKGTSFWNDYIFALGIDMSSFSKVVIDYEITEKYNTTYNIPAYAFATSKTSFISNSYQNDADISGNLGVTKLNESIGKHTLEVNINASGEKTLAVRWGYLSGYIYNIYFI